MNDEPESAMKALRGPLSRRATSAEFNEWMARDVVQYIEAIRERLAEADKVCDSYAAENQRLHDRAEAAEEANKRLRAETIEECAKAVEEGIGITGALPYSSIWSALKGAAGLVRSLASETAGGGE